MTGRHRAIDRVAQLEAENHELVCQTIRLARENDTLQRQLDTTGIALTGAWADLETAVAEIRRLQQQHIDDTVRMARLRRDLHNARPRITRVDSTAERPTAPGSIPLRAA
ncbi:hypothetical protein [Streptomyces sparsogenes]|uniref:Uncharacterized protein n=1 Tax=Streptomyces sparsogenes DSM 40356 TaxID=1331668 RepID=A0A1R1S8F3_9ACTN|nr:hypothetical protein [Streptomyces sparsogenes]OMI34462.1 hypothetical protein SPAR_36801 [Streptomyces sparsogenes DSM 40356]